VHKALKPFHGELKTERLIGLCQILKALLHSPFVESYIIFVIQAKSADDVLGLNYFIKAFKHKICSGKRIQPKIEWSVRF